MNYPQLSQRDPRWGKIQLGFGDCDINDDGCLLACDTMLSQWSDVAAMNTYRMQHGGFQTAPGKGACASTYDLLGATTALRYTGYSGIHQRDPMPMSELMHLHQHQAAGNPAIIVVNWSVRWGTGWLAKFPWLKIYWHYCVLRPDDVVLDPWGLGPGDIPCHLTDYGKDEATALMQILYFTLTGDEAQG